MAFLPQRKTFFRKNYYRFHLPTGPFHCAKFRKDSYNGRMHHFWTQNGPFAQMIFRKPANKPCSIHSCLSTCQKSKSDIDLLMKYWWLNNAEISLVESHFWLTWEPDFSQTCSFRRMLMNHKNFCFTHIPDKTNDMIFLKSPKNLFLGHFWPFLVISTQWGLFPKNPAVTHYYIWALNTMLSYRKS